jgi:hypothetical protein
MRTTIALSRRQVGATRRAGTFIGFSRAFVSSGLPERAPGGLGIAWARRMDESPNPGENEEPGARLGLFRRPDKKMAVGGLGFMAGDALRSG